MIMNPLALKQNNEKNKNDWCTPPYLFQRIQKVFNFEIDGASSDENKLLNIHYTKENPIIWQAVVHHRIFINPPFDNTRKFLEMCFYHTSVLSCLLLPFRPETKLWHEYVWPRATIFVFNKRIQYIHPVTKLEVKGAAFPSCLVIFGKLSDYPIENLSDLGVFIRRI